MSVSRGRPSWLRTTSCQKKCQYNVYFPYATHRSSSGPILPRLVQPTMTLCACKLSLSASRRSTLQCLCGSRCVLIGGSAMKCTSMICTCKASSRIRVASGSGHSTLKLQKAFVQHINTLPQTAGRQTRLWGYGGTYLCHISHAVI